MKICVLLIPLLMLSACGLLGLPENHGGRLSVHKKGYTLHPLKAPAGRKDGPYSGKASNGKTFKTYVRNGLFDRYFNVYYPGGRLHSHTPLSDGIASGWATIRVPQGKVRVLYRDGTSVRRIFYDKKGKKVKELQP